MTSAPTRARTAHRAIGWATFVSACLAIAGVLTGVLLWSQPGAGSWLAVIAGGLQILGAALIATQRTGGAIIALALASLGVLLAFITISTHPVWSCVLLTFDALALWAISVHGEELVQ